MSNKNNTFFFPTVFPNEKLLNFSANATKLPASEADCYPHFTPGET